MIETEFNFVRGSTYSRNFSLSDYEANIDNIYFTVKANENDRFPVLSKKLGNGITRLETEDESVKLYNLLINADDTEKLKANKPYYFDIKIISNDTTPALKKLIIKGTMTLDVNVTRNFNEK